MAVYSTMLTRKYFGTSITPITRVWYLQILNIFYLCTIKWVDLLGIQNKKTDKKFQIRRQKLKMLVVEILKPTDGFWYRRKLASIFVISLSRKDFSKWRREYFSNRIGIESGSMFNLIRFSGILCCMTTALYLVDL